MYAQDDSPAFDRVYRWKMYGARFGIFCNSERSKLKVIHFLNIYILFNTILQKFNNYEVLLFGVRKNLIPGNLLFDNIVFASVFTAVH